MKKLFLLLTVLIPILLFSQSAIYDTSKYQKIIGGFKYDGIVPLKVLTFPQDTVNNKNPGSVASINNVLYVCDNSRTWKTLITSSEAFWGSITGDINSQSDLINLLNLKEDLSNKDTSTSLGLSDILYPSQRAVKVYVDNGLNSIFPLPYLTPGYGMLGTGYAGIASVNDWSPDSLVWATVNMLSGLGIGTGGDSSVFVPAFYADSIIDQPFAGIKNTFYLIAHNTPAKETDNVTDNPFHGFEDNIVEVVSPGNYHFNSPFNHEKLVIFNDNTRAVYYEYIDTIWVFSPRFIPNGGIADGVPLDLFTLDSKQLRFGTRGKVRAYFKANGDMIWNKFKNLPENNFAKWLPDGTITWDSTHTWIAGAGIAIHGDTLINIGGTGGASAFISLTDVPNSYIGQDLKLVRVNSGATGLEFFTPSYLDQSTADERYFRISNNLSEGTASTIRSNLNLGSFSILNNPATTNADIIYYNGSSFTRLGIGTTNQILAVASGVPTWRPVSTVFDTTYNWTWTGIHTFYKSNGASVRDAIRLIDTIPTTTYSGRWAPSLLFGAHNWVGADRKLWGRFGFLADAGAGAVYGDFFWKIGTDTTALTNIMQLTDGGALVLGNGGQGNAQGLLSSTQIQTSNINTSIAKNGLLLQSGINFNEGAHGSANMITVSGGSATNTMTSASFGGLAFLLNYNQVTSTTDNRDIWIKRYEQSISTGVNNFIDVGTCSSINGGGTYTSKFNVTNKGVVNIIRPVATNGSAPSYTLGAGAGTSPTASISGNDISGYITINTGTSPSTGDIITITFATALTNSPTSIILTPANDNAIDVKVDADQASASASSFKIRSSPTTALAASTTYKFYYYITQ